MPKAICPPTVEQQQIRNVHNNNKSEIFKAYYTVFSPDNGLNDQAIKDLKVSLNDKKLKLRKLDVAIKDATKAKNFPLKTKLLDSKDKLNASLKELKKKIEDNKGKPQILARLEHFMVGHVLELLDEQAVQGLSFEVKPEILFNVMKEAIRVPRTLRQFDRLSELSKGDLLSVERQMVRDLSELRRLSKTLSKENGKNDTGYKLAWWQNEIMHPLAVARRLDPTGNSFKTVEASLQLAEKSYSARAHYEKDLAKIGETIADLVEGDKKSGGYYLYLMDNISKIRPGDQAKSASNIYKTLHEIGDGEKVRIVPTTIINTGEGGKLQFSDEFYKKDPITGKSDQEVWKHLIMSNAKNKINMNGWVQEYKHKVGKKEILYYYVMIKKIDPKTKAEYYRAYEAPYKTSAAGNNILQFPPTTGAKSVAFFQKWYSRKRASETIGGIKTFNARTKTWDLEPGLMKAGWYKATARANVRGNEGTKKEFIAQTYKNYVLDDQFNDWESKIENTRFRGNSSFGIHHDVWKSLEKLREMFANVADDIVETNKAFEEKLLSILPENITNFGRQDISKILKETYKIDVDVLDMNIAVRGEGDDRTIYTPNTQFSELFNYMPIMFNDIDLIINLLNARQSTENTLNELEYTLNTKIGSIDSEDIKMITPLRNKIKETKNVSDWYKSTVKRKLGLGRDEATFNQVTSIKAAKHRSEHSNPLEVIKPVKINGKTSQRITNNGRRKDGRVFHDYLQNTFTSIEQNKLKLELLQSVVNGMPDAIKEYTIDQVKAALGREDVNAGLFSLDFSDERWGLTDSEIGYMLQLNNKLISGNLLKGTSTSFTNNFQSLGYSVVSDLGTMWRARKWRINNPKEAADAAAYAGITDEIQTIADGLIGGALSSGGQEHWYTGLWNKAIMGHLLETNTKAAFVEKILK